MQLSRIATAALVAAFCLISLSVSAALAAPDRAAKPAITVNVTTDSLDKTPGDGKCEDKNGKCSLRAAIMETNALGGKNTVNLPAGKYILSLNGGNEDAGKKGDLDIRSNLTLKGASNKKTSIDGAALDRVIDIVSGKAVITGVTIKNGQARIIADNAIAGAGGGIHIAKNASLTLKKSTVSKNTARLVGGIFNEGVLVLTQSSVTGNLATGDSATGGGVASTGTATIDRSSILNNQANDTVTDYASGGGLLNSEGSMTVKRSTIANNTVEDSGGGIENYGTMVVENSTISSNTAENGGGVYVNAGGKLALYNVTIANNKTTFSGSYGGGGIYVGNGTVNWKNTIIAGNTRMNGTVDNCSGTLLSQEYNLMTDTTGCYLEGEVVMHDLYGLSESDVDLGPLQKNGGPTMTHALLTGSMAIDAGNPSGCVDSGNNAITSDQRGSARPTDGDAINGPRCDMGAFEK